MGMKNKICKAFISACLTMQTFALNVQTTVAKSIFDTDKQGSTEAISEFSEFYQHWWFLFLGVSAFIYYIAKDEKLKGYAKMVVIGTVVVFILTISGVQDVIRATLETIAGWLGA